MTKKDYIIIAKAIKMPVIDASLTNNGYVRSQLIIDKMCQAFIKENPKFDWQKFNEMIYK